MGTPPGGASGSEGSGAPCRMDHPAAALAVLAALGVFAYLPHLLAIEHAWGAEDFGYFQYLFEAGRTSIIEFGEFPGWSPWTCGGAPLHADPQTPFLSPAYLLVLAFGTVPGMKLYALAHLLAGLAGGWFLARSLGLRGVAALYLPVAFSLGARFAWVMQGGQLTMLPFHLLPWVLAFLHRSIDDQHWVRWAVAGAAVFALVLLEGGTYPAPLGALFLTGYAVYRLVEGRVVGGRLAWRAPASLAVVLGAGALLAAPKLLPLLDLLADHPRVLPASDDALGVLDLLRMFFTRRVEDYMVDPAAEGGLAYAWWGEYGAWLGPITPILALVAFARRPRENLPWLLLALGSAALMLGSWGPASPYDLLRRLPVFDSLRVPSRYAMLVTLALAVAASDTLERLRRAAAMRAGTRGGRMLAALPVAVLAVTAVDLSAFTHAALRTLPHVPVPAVQAAATFDKEPSWTRPAEEYVRGNRGTLACRSELLDPGDPAGDTLERMRGEVEVVRPEGTAVRVLDQTPNRMDLWVSAAEPPKLRLRTRYDRGWQADLGSIEDDAGVLALSLPGAGSRYVSLQYSADRVVTGFAVAAMVMATLLAASLWRRCRREAREPAAAPGQAAVPDLGATPPCSPEASRTSSRLGLLVGVGIAFLHVFPFPFFGRLTNPAEDSRLLMTRAIVDHGTFAVNESWGDGYLINRDLAVRDGKYYSCKAPGTSFLGVPVLFAARKLGVETKDRLEENLVMRLCVSTLPSLLFLLVFARMVRRYASDTWGRLLVVIGLSAGTMSLTYGILLYGHQQAAVALFGAFACLYANRLRGGGSARLITAAGALLGLAVSCEYQAALAAAVVAAYGLWTSDRWRRSIWIPAGAALPVAATLYYHHAAFGSVFSTGIDFLENAAYRAYQEHGFKGMFVFTWDGFFGTLLSPRNGLFFYAPWLLFFFPGIAAMWRRPDQRREAACCAAVFLVYVLYVSTLFAWKGGWSVGPRYLAAVVPFAALPVAAYLDTPAGRRPLARLLLAAAVVLSVIVYGLSSAVYPHLPEHIANPFYEFLLPLIETGHVPWTLLGLAGVEAPLSFAPYVVVLGALVVLVVWAGASPPEDKGAARRPPVVRLQAAALIVLVAFVAMWAMSRPTTADKEVVKSQVELADEVWEP